jgi:tungstate transport system ATP-binding protein
MRDQVSILPLTVKDITFEVSGKRLLDGVSFTLPKGGITAVIGPNGAGKSLTLRICHSLIAPSAGEVRWREGAASAGRKRHAMVFQRPVMLRRSALANLTHALNAVGATDAGTRAADALARFGLSEFSARPARLLSGGEQQRLAIARAWALDPEMLFLDEPSSQLDPGATRQIEEMIANLASEGMTILMATHDLAQARRLSQRVLFFHCGKIVEDAPAGRFWNQPETKEGRAFIAGDLLW